MTTHCHRRDILRMVCGAMTGGVLDRAVLRAAQARAQADTSPTDLFDLEKAGEGIYLALARPMAIINCNAVIFENARDVLVVDTHSRPSSAAALAAQIRRDITAKPVRYVINTHFHYDHSQGTGAYRGMSTPPEIIGTTLTRSLLVERGARFVKDTIDNSRKNIEKHKAELARATSAEMREYYRRVILELESFTREMKDYSPELPDITFDRDLVLHDRDRTIRLAFRGRAHTASDICVYDDRSKALATGDLVVGFVPGMGDGYPLEWPATLDAFREFGFSKVLPGHGPLQTGHQVFQQQRAYVSELIEAISRVKKSGGNLEEAQRTVTPLTLRTLDRTGFGGYVAAAEGRFRLRPPGSDIWDLIGNSVKGNVAAVWSALAG